MNIKKLYKFETITMDRFLNNFVDEEDMSAKTKKQYQCCKHGDLKKLGIKTIKAVPLSIVLDDMITDGTILLVKDGSYADDNESRSVVPYIRPSIVKKYPRVDIIKYWLDYSYDYLDPNVKSVSDDTKFRRDNGILTEEEEDAITLEMGQLFGVSEEEEENVKVRKYVAK